MALHTRPGPRPPIIWSTVGSMLRGGPRRKAKRANRASRSAPVAAPRSRASRVFARPARRCRGKPGRSLLRLLSFARKRAGMALLGIVLTIAATAASMVPPYLTRPMLDKVLIPYQKGKAGQFLPDSLVAGRAGRGSVLTWLLSWARTYVVAWVSERIAVRSAQSDLRPFAAPVAGVFRRQADRRPDLAGQHRHGSHLLLPVGLPAGFRQRHADDRHDGGHPAVRSTCDWPWPRWCRCR